MKSKVVNSEPDWRFAVSSPVHFMSLGLGSGLSPIMPGTAGGLVGIPLGMAVHATGHPWLAILLILTFVLGCWACQKTGEALQHHDHKSIVWDEVWGVMAVIAICGTQLVTILAGFILFRFFDIVKPWPIRLVDRRINNGFGVMLDDGLAAVAAIAVIMATRHFF